MAISYVGIGTYNSGSAGITVATPSGIAAGDLLVAAVETANQTITTSSSGWTTYTGTAGGTAGAAGGIRCTVFYKITDGSDTGIVLNDSGNHQLGVMLAYRGVDSSSPINASASQYNASSTTLTCPSVTTTVANTAIIAIAAIDRDVATTTQVSGWTCTFSASIVEVFDRTVTTGQGGGLGIATEFAAAIGATGTVTVLS